MKKKIKEKYFLNKNGSISTNFSKNNCIKIKENKKCDNKNSNCIERFLLSFFQMSSYYG